ncbi:hypothetical protein [Streptomyces sp. NPDC048442]|uniref:hypothetical protein n=1 Tax=Streptomyces sp. NPDC048442 TaxID=3154823 RepID=UPI003438624A
MPDAGDRVTATLAVDPHDGTTAAVLTVYAPDGTATTPVTTTGDGGGTWSAPVVYTVAGVWTLAWSVTGTGASVEGQKVAVGPAPGPAVGGRRYATSTQLANYLHTAPPLDADRLLERATTLLDANVLRGAWYAVDAGGLPTNPTVAAAFAEAVCAVIEFWGEVGEENDTSGPIQGVSIGSAQIQYGAGANRSGPTYVPERAYRVLSTLSHEVFHYTVRSC